MDSFTDDKRDSANGHPSSGELRAYVENAIDPERLHDLRLHLADCVECLALAEWLKSADDSSSRRFDNTRTSANQSEKKRPGRLHLHLLQNIHTEIWIRERAGPPIHKARLPAIPSDSLVELAGRLASSASAGLLAVCRSELWPRLRAVMGVNSPGSLSAGSFSEAMNRAAESSAQEQALLQTRINAAWYLAGLEELWPFEGVSAARRLWYEGRLKDFDSYLRGRIDLLRPAIGDLLASIVDLRVDIDNPWYGVLREILPPEELPEKSALCEILQKYDATAEAMVFLRSLLYDELGEESEEAAIHPLHCTAGFLLEIESQDGSLAAVWFAPDDAERLRLDFRGHTAFDALVKARVFSLNSACEEESEKIEPVRVARFNGIARAGEFVMATDALEIPAIAFSGGHNESVAALRRTIIEGAFLRQSWTPEDVPETDPSKIVIEAEIEAAQTEFARPSVVKTRRVAMIIKRLRGLAAVLTPTPLNGMQLLPITGTDFIMDRPPSFERLENEGITLSVIRDNPGGQLVVTVVRGQKPLAAAGVNLDFVSADGTARTLVSATTNDDGVAYFGAAGQFSEPAAGCHYRFAVTYIEE